MTLSGIVLGAPDARALASFYRRPLGWTVEEDEPNWVTLRAPTGGPGVSFQTEAAYVTPTWPTVPGDRQMMVHLDVEVDEVDEVDDLAAAGAHAVAAGARLAAYQPQDDVRVYLDPAGHPFCLWVQSGWSAGHARAEQALPGVAGSGRCKQHPGRDSAGGGDRRRL